MRKEKQYHFIYKTTNLLSGRYYIGMHSTNNLDDGYLGSGYLISRAIKKHGKENFVREILEFCNSREELKSREKEIVTLKEIAKEECMNLVTGGGGGFISLSGCTKGGINMRAKYKEETKVWGKKGGYNRMLKHGIDVFLENRITRTNIKHSEEAKLKISKANSGEGNSQYGTCWITKDGINKKIKKEDLTNWELEGWVKGLKREYSINYDTLIELNELHKFGISHQKLSIIYKIPKSTIINNLKRI